MLGMLILLSRSNYALAAPSQLQSTGQEKGNEPILIYKTYIIICIHMHIKHSCRMYYMCIHGVAEQRKHGGGFFFSSLICLICNNSVAYSQAQLDS